MNNFAPKKTHLFTPGPTPVPDTVLREMSAPIMHHRTGQYQEAFGEVLSSLKLLFGTEQDVATFASSGSGAMESAVVNLVRPGDEVVVAAHGRFGLRWKQLAERVGATVHLHETERGESPDPNEVAKFVASKPQAVAVFLTHSETSTGAVSDAQAIAEAIRLQASDKLLLVLDAVSSLGVVPVKMDEWKYDAIVSGSQKGLMVPPGLSMAAISARAYERACDNTSGRWYFDWKKAVEAHRKTPPSTPVTPAISIVLGLRVALNMMLNEGLDNVYARHARLGRATRAAVQALGFELFSPNDDSSAALTAVRVPDDASWGEKITGSFKEYGVTIAGGQDDLKGKIFRLGHCGWVNDLDLILLIGTLERVLFNLGHTFEVGSGLSAAQNSLLSAEVSV